MTLQSRYMLAEERYRLLVDAITDYAIFMLDPHGVVTSWNAGAERIKLYSQDEILGKHFSIFYLPEAVEEGRPDAALREAAEDGRFEAEAWRVRKDGSRFWAHVIIDPIWARDGALLGFAKITRDLTERREAEEQLRRSEEQFRRLVQGVTDYAIYMMDPEGRISSWNAGAERIKGYSAEEIVGQHFSKFFTQEDLDAGFPSSALQIAASDGRFESEGWRVRKNGTTFWANAVIDAIHDDNGELIGFAKITRDITETREREQELALAREELFQAQKMEAVGQLTGGVAHDFNNLLMAIQGSLELLRKRMPHSSQTAPLLANALQATQRGASLTHRMLAFSRKQELKLEVIDLHELVSNMTELLRRSLGPAVTLETNLPAFLPSVRTDPNQLESALLNLAINARDAMPNGGRLVVGADINSNGPVDNQGKLSGPYVRLWVKDEGEGMDEETLSQALIPFFTTKGVGKGTGLGLPMVQGFLAQTGGKLLLRSTRYVGTTAELWLPVVEGEIKMVPENPHTDVPAPLPGLTVLAVDDDALVLMNTVMMLQDLGHNVLEANSASEALGIFAESTVDLVITDHAMPKMTGSELASRIEKLAPGTPIILATGYVDLPAGANPEYPRLSKPFSESDLIEVVAKAMQGATAKRA